MTVPAKHKNRSKTGDKMRRMHAKDRPVQRGSIECGHPGCDYSFASIRAAEMHRKDKHGEKK